MSAFAEMIFLFYVCCNSAFLLWRLFYDSRMESRYQSIEEVKKNYAYEVEILRDNYIAIRKEHDADKLKLLRCHVELEAIQKKQAQAGAPS